VSTNRGPMPRRGVWDCALLALAALAAASVAVHAPGAVRVTAVLVAACLLPGGALLTLLPGGEAPQTLGYAVGLGLAVETLGALAMIWSGFWHPVAWSILLGGAASCLLATDLRRQLTATSTRAGR